MPRPQTTTAMLLATIAMVAADLGLLRQLVDYDGRSPFGLGLLWPTGPWFALHLAWFPMINLWGVTLLMLLARRPGGRPLFLGLAIGIPSSMLLSIPWAAFYRGPLDLG